MPKDSKRGQFNLSNKKKKKVKKNVPKSKKTKKNVPKRPNLADLKKKMKSKKPPPKQDDISKTIAGIERVFVLLMNLQKQEKDLSHLKWSKVNDITDSQRTVITTIFEFCGNVREVKQSFSRRQIYQPGLGQGSGDVCKDYRELFTVNLDGKVTAAFAGEARSKGEVPGLDVCMDLFANGAFQIISKPAKVRIKGRKHTFDEPNYWVYRGDYKWFGGDPARAGAAKAAVGGVLERRGFAGCVGRVQDAVAAYLGEGADRLELRIRDEMRIDQSFERKEPTDSWVIVYKLENILDRDCRLKVVDQVWFAQLKPSGQVVFQREGETEWRKGMKDFLKTVHKTFFV